jgi:hypothetical protein
MLLRHLFMLMQFLSRRFRVSEVPSDQSESSNRSFLLFVVVVFADYNIHIPLCQCLKFEVTTAITATR